MRFTPVLFIVTICICLNGYSQSVKYDSLYKPKKISYFFSLQSGTLIGDKDADFSTSTIQGIKIGRRLRVGAGIGYDSYELWRAVPFFGSASWDLFGKKNVVFTQINYGWAKSWRPSGTQDYYGLKDDRGGVSFSTSLGYRIQYGDMRIALLAGYKFQRVESYYEYSIWSYAYDWPYAPKPSGPTSFETIEQEMKRFAISLMVGWK